MFRKLMMLISLLGALRAFAVDLDTQVQFNIPAQTLSSALVEFGRQTSIQIMTASADVEGLQASAVQGKMTIKTALSQLLAGTRLTFERAGDNSVAIGKRSANQSSAAAGTMSLAQASAEDAARDEHANAGTTQDAVSSRAIPEILVTGSRTLNADARRSRDSIQPYTVFDREAIARSGAKSVNEFIKYNLSSGNNGVDSSLLPNGGNRSQINIRGLGMTQTLVLIDGRRAVSIGASGSTSQPDLNGLPTSAIDRIEVLPVTASGIYGGSATGGVINVVLRRDYAGFETELLHEDSFDGGGRSDRFSINGGFSLEGGRTSVILGGGYLDAGVLRIGQRDLIQRARAHAPNRALMLTGTTPPLGATTNIRSTSGAPLTFKTAFGGGAVGSFRTFVPYDYAGPASDNGAQLIANAGQYNFDLADTAQIAGRRASLANSPTVTSFTGSVRRQFTLAVEGFLELAASDNSGEFLTNPLSATFVLGPLSAGNPFNEQIRVTTPALGADQVAKNDVYNRRAVAGVIIKLSNDWRLSLDHTWNRVRYHTSQPNATILGAATTAVTTGALDLFRDTNTNDTSFDPYTVGPTQSGPSHTLLNDTVARVAGSLPWSLGAGPISTSLSLERRSESLDDFQIVTQTATTPIVSEWYGRSQSIESVFVESNAPLFARRGPAVGEQRIDLQLALRGEQYTIRGSNFSSSFNPQPPDYATNTFSSLDPTVGLRLQLSSDVTLRASYGTGFLPPSMTTIVPGETFSFGALDLDGLFDPRRGGEPLALNNTVEYQTGGNPDLNPETSTSRSAGIIVTPRVIPNLRLSADWIKIDKKDNVFSIDLTQDVLDNEDDNAQLITRGPASDGFPVGPVIGYDGRFVNVAHTWIEALDMALDYRLAFANLGTFTLAATATHNIRNESQILVSSPITDVTGLFNNLDWRGAATLGWERGPWSAAWTAQYFDSYWLNSIHTVVANMGSATVPSQIYHNAVVRYEWGSQAAWRALSNTEVQLGVRNVFGRKPPVDLSISNYYSLWGDPRLSTYWLSFKKAFTQ